MSYLNYPKFIDLSQVPEKMEFESTDMLFIQNINEENAAIQKKNIVFPTNQLVFEKQLQDTQTILQNSKQIIDNISNSLNQGSTENLNQLLDSNYTDLINQMLSSLNTIIDTVDEKFNQIDFSNLSQLQVEKTLSTEYYDSGWVDLKTNCTDFTHTLGTIPLNICVSYKLKESLYGWSQGTIFYGKLPCLTATRFDRLDYAGGQNWIQEITGNINQIGNKIYISVPMFTTWQYWNYSATSFANNNVGMEQGFNFSQEYYTKFQARIIQYKRNG